MGKEKHRTTTSDINCLVAEKRNIAQQQIKSIELTTCLLAAIGCLLTLAVKANNRCWLLLVVCERLLCVRWRLPLMLLFLFSCVVFSIVRWFLLLISLMFMPCFFYCKAASCFDLCTVYCKGLVCLL